MKVVGHPEFPILHTGLLMSFLSSILSSIFNRDVDKIADLMDDIQEQQDIANEISEAISNPVGFGADVDEDELLAELDELEQVRASKCVLERRPC